MALPRRHRKLVRRLALTTGIVAVLAGILGSTWAIYSQTTANTANAFDAGTVAIGDDDAGVKMFNLTGLGPGQSGSKCIRVTYSGTQPADVHLYASATSGALAPYVRLNVTEAREGSTASCGAFAARSLNYVDGALDATPTTYAAGMVGGFAPVAAGQTRVYRVGYTIDPAAPLSTMSTSATIDLRWQAQGATPLPLQMWGSNAAGGLGVGDTSNRLVPTAVGTDLDWIDVAPGYRHTCAIKAGGTLYCWGLNDNYQLGLGNTTNQTSPTQVGSATDWASVTAGGYHSCAIKTSGALYCWGQGTNGATGAGDTAVRTTPTQVGSATDWATVIGADSHTCATKTTGALYCWGLNSQGQLGLNDLTQRNAPAQVGTDLDWSVVSIGGFTTCATKSGGTLYCWGYGTAGALGLGADLSVRKLPTQVGTDTDWATLSVGGNHACAIKTTGKLFCWGLNANGSNGVGDTTQRNSPVQVGLATDWAAVAAGTNTTCALRTSGALYCWGWNVAGQVGVNNTTDYTSPTLVGTGYRELARRMFAFSAATRRPT